MAGKEVLFQIRIDVQQEKQLDKLKQRMDYLIARQKEHKNLTKEETAELKAVRKEYNTLNTTLSKQAGLQTTQANTLGRVNAELAIQRRKIQDVVIGSKDYKLIGNRIKELETKQRQYNAAIGRGKTFVGEYAKGAISAFKQMAAGILVAVMAFRRFSRLLSSSIETLAEFEQGQINVQTLLEDFDTQLKSESIDLMKRYGLAISDMNRALFDAVSAGVAARDSLKFLDEAALLATAGVSDMESVVDGMTTVMNVWDEGMGDMSKVSAAFFSAQKKGKFYVADLASEIGKSASIAKVAGLSYQELMATYAELTKRGLPLELSTTAIKAAILAVTKPSKEAKEVFEKLEIQTGLNAVTNQGLFNILRKINSATEADKDLLTELIPNVRALTGVTILNREALDDYDKILKIVNEDFGEGSSIMKAYELQTTTLTFQKKKLTAAWQAFILESKVGNALGEAYRGILKGLTATIEAVSGETESHSVILEKQNIEVSSLIGSITSLNEGNDIRKDLIGDLNLKYPKLLENINTEKVTNEELLGILQDYNKEIDKKIKRVVWEEELAEIEERKKEAYKEEKQIIKDIEVFYTTWIKNRKEGLSVEEKLQAIKTEELDLAAKYSDAATIILRQSVTEGTLHKTAITTEGNLNEIRKTRNELQSEYIDILKEEPPAPPVVVVPPTAAAEAEKTKLALDAEAARWEEMKIQIHFQAEESLEIAAGTLKIKEGFEKEHLENLKKLREDDLDKYRESEEYKRDLAAKSVTTALMAGNVLIAMNRKRMEKELGDAGDNEEKKAEIRKKYAQKEQLISIAQAIISGAEGILKTGANLGYPLAIPFQILQGLQTLMQIAIIKAQKFAKGGIVSGFGDKDTVPAMLTPGEGMINRRTMQSQDVLSLTGRPFDIASQLNSYKGFGIPFAAGGVIPGVTNNTYNQMNEATINSIVDRLNAREIKVYQNVHEVIEAQREIRVIQNTSEL